MTAPADVSRARYVGGCALVLASGLVLSLGVLCVRGATGADAWQYLFWRAAGFTAVLAFLVAWRHRASPLTRLARLGGFGWLAALAMVGSQVCFVLAIKSGNTAEVFFLMSLAPLMAAALARPILGERIGPLGLLAIAVALGGVALMSGLDLADDGLHSGLWEGDWVPRALALGCALTFALYSLAMRGAPPEDLDAALLGSGLVTALVAVTVMGVLGIGVLPGARDVGLGLLHGGVVLAIGLVLFARGSRTVPGVTLVMLAQAETVAAPVLTWLFLGETTTLAVVAGGAIILVAVVLQAMDGTARRSAAAGGAGATQTDTTRG